MLKDHEWVIGIDLGGTYMRIGAVDADMQMFGFQKVSREDVYSMRRCVESVYTDEKIKNYVLDIVFKTREPSPYIACGASPRASVNLIKAARCRAFLQGRDYAAPDDVKAMAYDVLRHRILLSYEAEAEDVTSEKIIEEILETVNLP